MLDTRRHSARDAGLTDGTYLKWLAKTMEFLLCEHLPSLGVDDLPRKNGHTTLSIWLPTRSIRNATSPEALQRDLRFDNVNDMLESVGGLFGRVSDHTSRIGWKARN